MIVLHQITDGKHSCYTNSRKPCHVYLMCIAQVVTDTEEKNGLFDLIYFDQAFYKDK